MISRAVGAVWGVVTVGVLVPLLAALRASCSSFACGFAMTKSLAVVAAQGIWDESLNSDLQVSSFDRLWWCRQIEGKDERVGWFILTIFFGDDVLHRRDTLRPQGIEYFVVAAVSEITTANHTTARV